MANERRKLMRGPIEAHGIYPLSVFLARLGIGRSSLAALRRRGLKMRMIGTRAYIDGAEAVAVLRRIWAEDEAAKGSQSPSDQ